ncbi:hypothetical protein [Phytohalomonas tamaricis]|uniref:hypothetical protein n=1 Tax=Phytohalomonas tamaricis TaxID=2081032 RepID=UPI000D0B068D|nr:hypothetical protein [Phytohalomonas tamaricis]
MSKTANWSYQNVATIWPEGERDPVTRQPTWGEPFTIACTFEAGGDLQADDNGQQFSPRYTVYHEDQRTIAVGSRILIGVESADTTPPSSAESVRRTGMWDMSFFNEEPDFVLWT